MIHAALHRPVPVELTADPRIARRVIRLAATSAVVLGLVWALAMLTLGVPGPIGIALALGWILMPVGLVASLWHPAFRYGLVVPSTLVGAGLAAIIAWWRPADAMAAAGWCLVTVGVLMGGLMGLWLWFRLAPVPRALDDPFSAGRWALIVLHVGLVVLGLVLIVASGVAATGEL